MKLLPQIQVEGGAEWLARTATQCLIDEARLSPKPGLVDSRGNGAHHDLSLALMECSAHSLTSTFQALALQSWQRPADIALRQTVGRLGREGEQQMMAATGGVNTHRGAIWALGLLVSAVAMLGGDARAQDVARTAAQLARHVFVQKKYRDALFRRIFNERSVLLELYNALNQTSYDDADELIFFTIDDVIYFGKQYESYIKQNNLNIYGKKLLKLPFPQFVIFYNGIEPLENGKDYMELHLSDAFDYESKAVNGRPCLEYTARIYNINYGHNQELITRCRTLEEYSILISRISSKVRSGASLEQAADTAVLECIKDGILKDFLTKHRSEVVGMLLEEFDMDEYIKMERRDSYADGHEDGLATGIAAKPLLHMAHFPDAFLFL